MINKYGLTDKEIKPVRNQLISIKSAFYREMKVDQDFIDMAMVHIATDGDVITVDAFGETLFTFVHATTEDITKAKINAVSETLFNSGISEERVNETFIQLAEEVFFEVTKIAEKYRRGMTH